MYFLNRFDKLISKMIFKKWKNIIDMLFGTKSYLKNNRYHTPKYPLTDNLCASLTNNFLPRITFFFFNFNLGIINFYRLSHAVVLERVIQGICKGWRYICLKWCLTYSKYACVLCWCYFLFLVDPLPRLYMTVLKSNPLTIVIFGYLAYKSCRFLVKVCHFVFIF